MMDNGRQKSAVSRMNFGVLILAVTGLGAVYAANLSLDTNTPAREFSQGSYQLKACDSWISMDLNPTSTGEFGAPAGLSPLGAITISNLDTKACANTRFGIDIFDFSGQKLPAYRTDGVETICDSQRCENQGSAQGEINFTINSIGLVTLRDSDNFHSLSHDPNTSTYKVSFRNPAILANDVGHLIIQSGDL